MALTGPEGETHSHIDRNKADAEHAGDRGHWVGPRSSTGRDGQPAMAAAEDWSHRNSLPLDPPESTLPKLHGSAYDPANVREWAPTAIRALEHILDHAPTTRAQRGVLTATIDFLCKL